MQGRPGILAEDRVAAVMATHGRALLRVANRWSLCHDDAMDAYQRALEIFLRRIDAIDPATEVAWLRVVVKHEALAIRRARSASVSGDDVDVDQAAPSAARSVEDVVAGEERVKRSAEALRALKPDEARALMLKAEGLSYAEIGERCGWSYTKVNRAITEGRRRFLEVFRAIESGDACSKYAGTLAALAGGTATSAEIVEIRPHLRHCLACRATVRQLHVSRLSGLQLLLPGWVATVLAWRGGGRGFLEHAHRLKSADEILHEAPVLQVPTPSPTPDAAALLDPDTLADAIESGGQIVVPLDLPERLEHARRFPRLSHLRDEALGFLGRAPASDVATSVQITAMGGGGRIATIATVIGFCVSGVGAGALCVATGVVEAPRWISSQQPRPARTQPRPVAKRPSHPGVQQSVTASIREPHLPVALHKPPTKIVRIARPSVSRPQTRNRQIDALRRAERAQTAEFGFESARSPSPTPLPTQQTASPTAPRRSNTDPARLEFGP